MLHKHSFGRVLLLKADMLNSQNETLLCKNRTMLQEDCYTIPPVKLHLLYVQ